MTAFTARPTSASASVHEADPMRTPECHTRFYQGLTFDMFAKILLEPSQEKARIPSGRIRRGTDRQAACNHDDHGR